MRRLVAAVATAAFLAACSDSSTTAPRSGLQPGGRLAESDPPPPPLSGAGTGFLSAASGDFASANVAVASSTLPVCASGGMAISYLFKYTQNNTNNEMAHLDISGSSQGQVTMHELTTAGRSDAKGRVTDGSIVIDITDGEGALTQSGFFYTITGTLTDLQTGAKCQIVAGSLSGNLVGEVVP